MALDAAHPARRGVRHAGALAHAEDRPGGHRREEARSHQLSHARRGARVREITCAPRSIAAPPTEPPDRDPTRVVIRPCEELCSHIDPPRTPEDASADASREPVAPPPVAPTMSKGAGTRMEGGGHCVGALEWTRTGDVGVRTPKSAYFVAHSVCQYQVCAPKPNSCDEAGDGGRA